MGTVWVVALEIAKVAVKIIVIRVARVIAKVTVMERARDHVVTIVGINSCFGGVLYGSSTYYRELPISNIYVMNEVVKYKINALNDAPKYISDFSHVTDQNRLFDLAKSVYDYSESVVDVIEVIKEDLSSSFEYRNELIKECEIQIPIINRFLDFIKHERNCK